MREKVVDTDHCILYELTETHTQNKYGIIIICALLVNIANEGSSQERDPYQIADRVLAVAKKGHDPSLILFIKLYNLT